MQEIKIVMYGFLEGYSQGQLMGIRSGISKNTKVDPVKSINHGQ